jgi:CRP/FNR family transcriptional regulator/CRP/FNR family cyclic AMP-dependent transcriptional regulator
MAVRDSLAEVPLFAELQGADIDLIAQRVRQRRYRGGEAIFHRDDPGHALYIILSGRVKVHNETPDGSDVILAVLAEGEFFGDLSILDGEPRSADVSTLEPTEALVLTRDDLLDCIRQAPQIAINLLATLAGRLRRTNESLTAVSTLDVPGKLAKVLLQLADRHGIVTTEGIQIEVRLTQSDLAALVGASRESVNKVLGGFRKQGVVRLDEQHRTTILKRDVLERRARG